MAASFCQTITFLAEITTGGPISDGPSNQYQRWHCGVLAEQDANSGNRNLDNTVVNTCFHAETTFFERASYRYPTPRSVALITGKFFLTKTTPTSTEELRVRAEPIRVYVHVR